MPVHRQWRARVHALQQEDLVPNITEPTVMGSVTRAFTEPGTKHHSSREQDETNPDMRKLRTQRAFLEQAALN